MYKHFSLSLNIIVELKPNISQASKDFCCFIEAAIMKCTLGVGHRSVGAAVDLSQALHTVSLMTIFIG